MLKERKVLDVIMCSNNRNSIKKDFLREYHFWIAIIILSGCFILLNLNNTIAANAASPSVEKKYEFVRYKKYMYSDPNEEYIYINNFIEGRVISDIQIDETIATVKEQSDTGILLKLLSEGKTQLSFKYGSKELSTTIYVKDYVNPCAKFKIGSNDFKNKFEKAPQYILGKQKKDWKAKLSIEPKEGWEILYITNNDKRVKNNGTIFLSVVGRYGTGSNIEARFKNNETNDVVVLDLGFDGQDTDQKYNYFYDEELLAYNFSSAGENRETIIIGSGSGKCVYEITSDTNDSQTVSLKSISKKAAKLDLPLAITNPETGQIYKVTGILMNAVYGHGNLKSVVIRGNIKTIGTNAFWMCPKLSDITLYGNSLSEVGMWAFTGIKEGALFKVEAKDEKHYNKLKKLLKRSGVKKIKLKYRFQV